MATVNSLQMTNPRYPVSGPGIGGRSLKMERAEVNLALTGALASGDVINLFKLHPGFRPVGGYVKQDGLGASTTLIVGDAGDPDRYFASASTAAAGVNTTMAATGVDYAIPRQFSTVTATVGGATTNATGNIVVVIYGTIEEPK